MKVAEGQIGRVFIMRLDDGDLVPNTIEEFAAENNIKVAFVSLTGGVGRGEVIVGPHDSDTRPIEAMHLPVEGAHEICALGVLAPDPIGRPVLHIHGAMGRNGVTLTGCLRLGVETWLVGEAIIYEILGSNTKRVVDQENGFLMLDPDSGAAPAQPEVVVAAPEKTSGTKIIKASKILHIFNAEVN
jgi:predicted DNA-binding protein with PD1-like motif